MPDPRPTPAPSTMYAPRACVSIVFESKSEGRPLGTFYHRLILDDSDGIGHVTIQSLDSATRWSAFHHWPKRDRGTDGDRASLLGFLLGCDLHYLAQKFRLDAAFDYRRTRAEVLENLKRHNPSNYQQLSESVEFVRRSDFDEWLSRSAPKKPGNPYERFVALDRIEPDFELFYACAWPTMRANRTQIEAQLYRTVAAVLDAATPANP